MATLASLAKLIVCLACRVSDDAMTHAPE